jgi:hypothetical protein
MNDLERRDRPIARFLRNSARLTLSALLVLCVVNTPALADGNGDPARGGGHGGGGGGGARGGGGGHGGGHGGGGGRGGGGGYRGGRGGYGGWGGGYYPGPAVVFGSPYYCTPPLVYAPDYGYDYCE